MMTGKIPIANDEDINRNFREDLFELIISINLSDDPNLFPYRRKTGVAKGF
jgi:hypothetical protein